MITNHENWFTRLEVLRLCYRHDYTPEQIIERADKLTGWVEPDKAPQPQTTGDKPQRLRKRSA